MENPSTSIGLSTPTPRLKRFPRPWDRRGLGPWKDTVERQYPGLDRIRFGSMNRDQRLALRRATRTDTDYEPGKPLPQTIVVRPQP